MEWIIIALKWIVAIVIVAIFVYACSSEEQAYEEQECPAFHGGTTRFVPLHDSVGCSSGYPWEVPGWAPDSVWWDGAHQSCRVSYEGPEWTIEADWAGNRWVGFGEHSGPYCRGPYTVEITPP